jgi:hypothetical protein
MKVSKLASLRRDATGYSAQRINQNFNMELSVFKAAYKGRYLTPEEEKQMNVSAPQGMRAWLTDSGEMMAIAFEGGI